MKKIFLVLLTISLSPSAFGLLITNYMEKCVYIKDIHRGHHSLHLNGYRSYTCSYWESPECSGHFKFQVLKHSHKPEHISDEVLCSWEGDITSNADYISIWGPEIWGQTGDHCTIVHGTAGFGHPPG